MYRQLRAIGAALLGTTLALTVTLSEDSAQAASTGKAGTANAATSATSTEKAEMTKAATSATASFQDRDAQAGKIGGILYFDDNGASAAQGYEAYLLDDKGKRYGKAIGTYVPTRRSFVIPEGTKLTGKAAALGVYAASDRGKPAAAPLAKTALKDYPTYLVGDLTYKDANPGAGAWASISWTDPADGSDYAGYQVEYPGGKQLVAKSSSGRYTLPLQDIDILGEVTVVPYRDGNVFEYSASARVQSYDDVRDEAPSWADPGDVNSTIAPVSDIHFKAVVSGGKTRVSGELSWYDADSSTAVNYIVYGADEAGRPVQPLVDVTNDYPFDGKAYRVSLPEFPLQDVASIAIYAIRDGGHSEPVSIAIGGDPDPLFTDIDTAKGTIGGTVYVMPRFPAYGATLQFVDAWQKPIGEPIDQVKGDARYFIVPPGTVIPPDAWKLVIYDSGGLEGSEYEKKPQYIEFEDR